MRKKPSPKPSKPNSATIKRKNLALVVVGLAGLAGIAAIVASYSGRFLSDGASRDYVPRAAGTVTFNKDIASILHEQCATCHRPGQSGPFNLVTYEDARKHARQIETVTRNRLMPPWLPEEGVVEFVGKRRLSEEQIGLIRQWTVDGMPEGTASEMSSLPRWPEGWQFGAPDLVVRMPETYTLSADGRDVYRNFVFPLSLTEKRFIRAIEFRPDTKALHHAIVRIDRTRQSRRLDKLDPMPGFGGMDAPPSAESPGGHFLSWQPGRGPTVMPEGLAMPLMPNSDLVVQMHMQPTGRPEPIRPTIALYFTDRAPTNTPFKISINSLAIDIPAGARDYEATESYVMPVDVDVLSVLPHAHYLGKQLEGFAVLLDGSKRWLLMIKDWDFNWQSDFRYARPVFLPKGSRLTMRYLFDNSAENLRNPSSPPVRVKYGASSKDEMAELWVQVLPRNNADYQALEKDYGQRTIQDVIAYNKLVLQREPGNAHAHTQLGKCLMHQRDFAGALVHFRAATRVQPDLDEARYHLGLIALEQGRYAEAETELLQALRSNPEYFKAHNNLGYVYLQQNRLVEAEAHFNEALRLNPGDPMATSNLRLILRRTSK